jgi:hypothetical protein
MRTTSSSAFSRDPDAPVTSDEYWSMRVDALEYGVGELLIELAREDRAFLIYEVNKYEEGHHLDKTFHPEFVRYEVEWWQQR